MEAPWGWPIGRRKFYWHSVSCLCPECKAIDYYGWNDCSWRYDRADRIPLFENPPAEDWYL